MCGIAGFSSFDKDYTAIENYFKSRIDILKKMRQSFAYRGNDQTGECLRRNVGFSHTRLSIRDISGGAQPMIKSRDGAEYIIVFNGEIYNTGELTLRLKSLGYKFETTCDTEVILLLYMQYGTRCVDYLNGIFAFAIWDGGNNTLMLARDRAGVKPLFYTVQNGELIFASEINGLFAHPDIKPRISINGFREIFGVGPARTHGCGVFDDVSEIVPGHFAVFSESGLTLHKYWDLKSKVHKDSYAETVDKVSYLVRDAITSQMVSDVPVCSFLSGGIDSSIVTAVSASYMEKSGGKLNTFSFDFSGNDKYFTSNSFQPERDRPYVDIMLGHIHTNHTYLECDEENLADLLFDAMKAKDLPGMADVDASMLYFCSLVKEKNKVALTGECADEIFGGYPWYRDPAVREKYGFPWAQSTAYRVSFLKPGVLGGIDPAAFVDTRYQQTLAETSIRSGLPAAERRMRQMVNLNFKWFMQTLLDRKDRMSMYSGLEVRVPFCDYRIAEYLYSVPWEFKDWGGQEKGLLREAMRGVLPDEVLWRRKSPYPKTWNPSYLAAVTAELRGILVDPAAPILRIIKADALETLLMSGADNPIPWYGQLMTTPQTIAWFVQLNYWLEKYKVELV